MNKESVTLYTMSWNNYWEKYGKRWCKYVNNFITKPDEIVIVSDVAIDYSYLNHNNVINIVDDLKIYKDFLHKHEHYRNMAVDNSSSDWVVSCDLDDIYFENFLCNLDDSADVFGFSYINEVNLLSQPTDFSLLKRLNNDIDSTIIPGTSAIKRSVFNNIRYENYTREDRILYATIATNSSIKYIYDKKGSKPRFKYNSYNFYKKFDKISKETDRITDIYIDILNKKRNLYVFWFSNIISENRSKALDQLKNNCGVNLLLINDYNFFKYENNEIPIHDAFKYLSDVHKSAYARTYMMYFYGGGYSDIKSNLFNWNKYFDELFYSRYDAIGYPEKKPDAIAKFWKDDTQKNITKEYNKFSGNGHYIFKPKTAFAYMWLTELHKILDNKLDELIKNPGTYHPYAVYGGIHESHKDYGKYQESRYPITWNEINGRIKHKIEYENGFSNFILEMPHPNMKDYR
jgi:hypothetical protein